MIGAWMSATTTHGGLLKIACPAIQDACCVAALIVPTVFTTEKADIRVEIPGRWSKGMTVYNFEKMGGMRHFGGTSSEQTNFRHTVAMKLDHAKFCDMIVDTVERLTQGKIGG
jgi:purine nucleosidase